MRGEVLGYEQIEVLIEGRIGVEMFWCERCCV